MDPFHEKKVNYKNFFGLFIKIQKKCSFLTLKMQSYRFFRHSFDVAPSLFPRVTETGQNGEKKTKYHHFPKLRKP